MLIQCGLLALVAAAYYFRVQRYFDRTVTPDAADFYLPMAKSFIEQGLSFLLQPESIQVPPVSYIWPALFGGEFSTVRYANSVAGIFMVALTYGIGRRLHSHAAGIVAALLFSISPLLISRIPTALAEPPFFLFTLIWFWSLGEVISGKKWAIPISALALTLSVLTRTVWLYPAILFLFFIATWMWLKPNEKKPLVYLSIALASGLVVPILVIIKNGMLFGVPSISLGSGGALFYGTNLMTNGFEPPMLGLQYESGQNALFSIVGNREHAAVAVQFLKERSLLELWDWYLTKITWVTFFTTLEAPLKQSVVRVTELALTSVCLWHAIKKGRLFAALIGTAIVLQIFQTAIVLYNIRYSVGGLELLLIPMAAVGIVLSLNVPIGLVKDGLVHGDYKKTFMLYRYGIASFAITSILVAGLYTRTVPVINLPPNVPVSILFSIDHVQMNQRLPPLTERTEYREYYIELDVPRQFMLPGSINALWAIEMARTKGCKEASLDFMSDEYPKITKREVGFNVHDDNSMHTYFLGTAFENTHLFPSKSGGLILKIDCPSSASILVNKVSLIIPHFIDAYFKSDL